MRDVVISVRVSTDEQAESGYSLAAQERAARAYCEMHGWCVVEVAIDDGYSGSLEPSRRPGLARALDLLRTRRANTLVIHKLDRLARSVKIINELLDEFQRRGWGLVAVADQIDLTTPRGIEFRGAHVPLVSEELWERCAKIREARERHSGQVKMSSTIDVFPQRVYCLSCGARCHHCTSGRETSRNGYYRCLSRRAAGERRIDCQAPGVPIATVERQVVDLLTSLEITDELRALLHEEAVRAVAVRAPQTRVDQAAVEAKINRVAELYADGLLG